MYNQRAPGTVEQKVFSTPHHLSDYQANKCLPKIRRHRPAHMGISYRDSSHPLPFKPGYDAATDNFDFSQFGQLDVRCKNYSMRYMMATMLSSISQEMPVHEMQMGAHVYFLLRFHHIIAPLAVKISGITMRKPQAIMVSAGSSRARLPSSVARG